MAAVRPRVMAIPERVTRDPDPRYYPSPGGLLETCMSAKRSVLNRMSSMSDVVVSGLADRE